MPIAPYSWQSQDFVSAGRLTSELRQSGNYYQGNGVRWHATRPVYRSYAKTTPSATAGVWNSLFSNTAGNFIALADPSHIDPMVTGAEIGSNLPAGGGLATSAGAGGLGLVITHAPYNTAATGVGASGFGITGGTHTSAGTVQPFPTANQPVNTLAVDLLDWGTNLIVGQFFGTVPWTANSTDGSGNCHKTQGFWASVYAANGTKLGGSALPSVTTGIVNGSSLTPAILNASIQQTMQLFNMPPALRVVATSGTSVTANAYPVLAYGTPTTDTYGAFASNTYTCPLPGLYLVYVCGGFDTATGSYIQNAAKINGTVYGGPAQQTINGRSASAASMRVFNLNAGDTIQNVLGSGATLTTSTTNPSVMVILWLGAAGAPQIAGLPVPDVTYQFAAGTPPGQVAGVLNNHVFNDVSRLLYRPYAMAYQSTPQTGLTQSAWTSVNLQTTGCPVHGTADNSYGSWSSGTWTAPTTGYYLVVGEVQCAQPSLTTAAYITTGLSPSPAGANVDQYQAQGCWTGGPSGGAAAIAIYYLRAGDSMTLKAMPAAQSATTSSLYSSGNNVSHMEIVWLGE